MAEVLSIADLENQIDQRKAQVLALFAKREELQAQIDQLDSEIGNVVNLDGRPSRRRGKPRPKNETSLRAVVLQVLGKNKKGLSLGDLADKILETGYKSNSRVFKNVVYQCLYNTTEIEHDTAKGVYKLKK